MPAVSKKEAQATLNAARTKAQHAQVARNTILVKDGLTVDEIDMDAAHMHYQRCIRELEEAINDMARFETSDDEGE